MAYFEKPIQYQIERIIAKARGTTPSVGDGSLDPIVALPATDTLSAPAQGDFQALGTDAIIASSIKITNATTGTGYVSGTDFQASATGFTNLLIPEGTSLAVTYMAEPVSPAAPTLYDEETPLPHQAKLRIVGPSVRAYADPEDNANVIEVDPTTNSPPEVWSAIELENGWTETLTGWAPASYYQDRERVWLRGRIEGGTTTTGTTLFTLPSGYRPTAKESPTVSTDSGPITLEITASGDAKIGDGVAGAGYLSLDNVSFRAASSYGARYPDESHYPNTNRYPNG